MIPILESGRAIFSLATAGGLWIAQQVTPDIPGVPPWVTALGFPMAMLVAVIYALLSVHKAYAASEKGRLDDKDGVIAALRADADKAMQSRTELTIATREQTDAFKALAAEMRQRPCQKP